MEISNLFKSISGNSNQAIERPLLIYGAGNTGRDILPKLLAHGLQVLGFIDKRFETKTAFEGLPVFGLTQAHEKFGENTPVLIAIHNRDVNMVALIHEIKKLGFKHVLTMFDYVKHFPDDTSFRYFLTSPHHLLSQQDQASAFYKLLSDEVSKTIYKRMIEFRLTGNYDICPLPEPARQYAPLDIPAWPKTLRLIDCGAYNGDSIKLFQAYGYHLEAVMAFEPDHDNYAKLIKNCDDLAITMLPCGVSSHACQARFNTGAGEGSRTSSEGDTVVQMVSIDQAMPTWQPNLIKMDIEGGELAAIQGASNIIKKHSPGLAISAYHLPADLWQLGLLIHDINPNYHFYLRSHAYSSFDTVLYAIPD